MKDRFTRISKVDRTRIRKEIRLAIYERDSFTCQFCGQQCSHEVLTIDHIIPLARGGVDEATNYVTACYDCNQKKADLPIHVFALRIKIDVSDIPVTGDPIIDNHDLPLQLRLLRKRVYDKARTNEVRIRGKQFQKKIEKTFRRDFWATEDGKRLENEFPNLPGHVRIMLPEIRSIAQSEREAIILVELAKSAKTRNLIGSLLNKGMDVEQVLNNYRSRSADPSMSKKIDQALARLEKTKQQTEHDGIL
jgi:5-methylcytosine-specific restriction protein A